MPTNLPRLPDPDPENALPIPSDSPLLTDPEGSGQPGIQWERYVAALFRHKWWILALTLCGTALGVLASRFVDPQFQSQATVWIESQRDNRTGPIRTEGLLESHAWIELLRSYTVLDPVVREQRLYVRPDDLSNLPIFSSLELRQRFRPGKYRLTVDAAGNKFTLLTDAGVQVQSGRVGEPIGEPAGFEWSPPPGVLTPGRTVEFRIFNPREIAIQLTERLQTSMARDGNFLRLSLTDTDAERTANTLNALLDRYVEVARELKRAKLDELTEVLDEQLRYAEQNLREAEIALESFRVATVTLPSDEVLPMAPGLEVTRDPVFSNFFELKIRKEQVRQDREAIERAVRQIRDSTATVNALAAIPAANESAALKQALDELVTKQAELRSLRYRYHDEHPEVQQLIEMVRTLEERSIPQIAMQVRQQLAAKEEDLEQRVQAASSELRQIPPRSIEEARLARQVDIADNLHTVLKQRYEEARLAAASSIPDIRVLDEAVVPHEPMSDDRIMLLLLGLAGGLGLSIAGILFLDRFDPRVRYPEQITQEMGLPVIGTLPEVKKLDRSLAPGNAHNMSEALRELRLSLMHAHGTAGPLMLTISSPESGDGKSFVASNLALSFADQGFRTLLIDGDVRRGELHHLMNVRRTPGLTDFLAGRASQSEIVQSTELDSVWMITAGTLTPHAPELLQSPRMQELLSGLRSQFDVILVDSPPLGAGVDPYVLSTATHNLLLVLRSGDTHRAMTEARLKLLDRLPIRILGALLNGVPVTRLYNRVYGYTPYLPGYELPAAEVEDATALAET